MKILIAVPTYETITPDTFKSIYDLKKGRHDCVFEFVRGYDCARARNLIAYKALEIKAKYVLMVDNDVTLPPDALLDLLELQEEICLGWYPRRIQPYDGKSTLFRTGERSFTQMIPTEELQAMAARGEYKLQVHGGGMGCALIRTKIFKDLVFPWFSWMSTPDGKELSEDLYFCESCRQRKIYTYADTRVGCGHIFRYEQR